MSFKLFKSSIGRDIHDLEVPPLDYSFCLLYWEAPSTIAFARLSSTVDSALLLPRSSRDPVNFVPLFIRLRAVFHSSSVYTIEAERRIHFRTSDRLIENRDKRVETRRTGDSLSSSANRVFSQRRERILTLKNFVWYKDIITRGFF